MDWNTALMKPDIYPTWACVLIGAMSATIIIGAIVAMVVTADGGIVNL